MRKSVCVWGGKIPFSIALKPMKHPGEIPKQGAERPLPLQPTFSCKRKKWKRTLEDGVTSHAHLADLISRVRIISIKIPMTPFIELERTTLKFTWNYRRPQMAKAILSRRDNVNSLKYPSSNSLTEP